MWWKYYNEMPFGYYRLEAREAFNSKISLMPHTKKDLDLENFMLFKRPKPEQTNEEINQKIVSFFGGVKNGG